MERKCFGYGRPYAFAPQEWSANVMPAAYRFRASPFAMTIIDRDLLFARASWQAASFLVILREPTAK
jgi:hypothetical protein